MSIFSSYSKNHFQEFITPQKKNKSNQNILNYTNETYAGSTNVSQRLFMCEKQHAQEEQIRIQYHSQIMSEQIILKQHQVRNLRLKVKVFRIFEKRLKSGFQKIYMYSKKYAQGRKRMVYGITRLFRTSQHQFKFQAFQNFKKISIAQRNDELKHTQNVFSKIYQTGCRLFLNYCKNKQKKTLYQALFKINMQARTNHSQRKNKMLKLYKFMLNSRKKCLIEGWKVMKLCRFNYYKKIKALQFMNLFKDKKNKNLLIGFTNIKRNMLGFKQAQIKSDKNIIQRKITHHQNEQEAYQYRQKVQYLQKQMQEINREKQKISLEHQNQKNMILDPLNILKQQILQTKEDNIRTVRKNQKLTQQINLPFSMDEISNFLYNNFLIFLNQNPNIPIPKQNLLKAIQTPLLPINVDIKLIKQQSIIMKQLLSQYIVIFGSKSLKLEGIQIQKPYEYLQKQNILLHNILLTLIGRLNMTKDDIGHIRDCITQMGLTVKQLDKYQNNLKQKQILLKDQLNC